jgi:hypothetical protein
MIAFSPRATAAARSPWRRSASPRPAGVSRSPDGQQAAAAVKAEDSIASGIRDAVGDERYDGDRTSPDDRIQGEAVAVGDERLQDASKRNA